MADTHIFDAFTPGPWEATDSSPIYICDHAGNILTTMLVGLRHGSEAEANARLIAAAPDLLAACRTAVEKIEDAQSEWLGVSETFAPEWTHPLKIAAAALNDAIAKATLTQAEEVARG